MNATQQDAKIRKQALDSGQSFIVQAPAGSGKTELLIQRYLTLLAEAVQFPEEIIAITFTRKAAAEMRERILTALETADSEQPAELHRQHTWQIAKRVMEKNKNLNWQLLANPNRLRIQTIDALCASISQQVPLLSRVTPELNIVENADFYYERAVEQFFQNLEKSSPLETAVKNLLLHLANKTTQLKNLFIRLLAKREQWLPHIISYRHDPEILKAELEKSLHHIAAEKMQTLQQLFPTKILQSLTQCLSLAAEFNHQTGLNNPLTDFIGFTWTLGITSADFSKWQTLAKCLIKTDSDWRTQIDANSFSILL